VADVERFVEPKRAAKLGDRLKDAQVALERERYSEAKRIAKSCLKEMSGVAAVHEVIGLSSYRLGQWREGAASLEIARSLRGRVEDLPVLADCYRALRRWNEVDEIWLEIKEASPSHEIMAEARIVVAGAHADRGDLAGALEIMRKAADIPKRVRDHHLRQWYVLGDLYDRAGNVPKAREFFRRVATHDRTFADVNERLAAL
jgi:tetratricopeptide (TPR) repeat protein